MKEYNFPIVKVTWKDIYHTDSSIDWEEEDFKNEEDYQMVTFGYLCYEDNKAYHIGCSCNKQTQSFVRTNILFHIPKCNVLEIIYLKEEKENKRKTSNGR